MFKNFKVIAYMRTPIATIEPIILDSVISSAYAKDLLKSNYYQGENIHGDEFLVIETLSKILDRKYDVFCTSQGIGENREFVSSWVKRFNNTDEDLIKFRGKGKKRIDVGGGPMKNYHMPIVLRSYKTIDFYVRGDMEEVKRLLTTQIGYLGKKGSQGFGQIKEWKFEEIEEDYSIFKDGKLMRPIPALHYENEKLIQQEHPLTPPYWREERIMCTIPEEF